MFGDVSTRPESWRTRRNALPDLNETKPLPVGCRDAAAPPRTSSRLILALNDALTVPNGEHGVRRGIDHEAPIPPMPVVHDRCCSCGVATPTPVWTFTLRNVGVNARWLNCN